MHANGGQGNPPAVAQLPNPQNADQPELNENQDIIQVAEVEDEGEAAHLAIGVLPQHVPLPAPYIPGDDQGHYDSDDDYQEPDPPLEFLE